MHQTVPIKVNAVVDEAIAPLVIALNRDEHILTVDSCQGGRDRPAYVFFRYSGSPADAPEYFFRFAKEIASRVPPEVTYELQLDWRSGNSEPMAVLRTSPEHVRQLAKIIESFLATQKYVTS